MKFAFIDNDSTCLIYRLKLKFIQTKRKGHVYARGSGAERHATRPASARDVATQCSAPSRVAPGRILFYCIHYSSKPKRLSTKHSENLVGLTCVHFINSKLILCC